MFCGRLSRVAFEASRYGCLCSSYMTRFKRVLGELSTFLENSQVAAFAFLDTIVQKLYEKWSWFIMWRWQHLWWLKMGSIWTVIVPKHLLYSVWARGTKELWSIPWGWGKIWIVTSIYGFIWVKNCEGETGKGLRGDCCRRDVLPPTLCGKLKHSFIPHGVH